jgi:hypothetical protein
MKVDRRKFLAYMLLPVPLMLGACSENAKRYGNTIGLWKDNFHYYKENVDSVLISADGKQLVFLGPDYHYIFDAPPALVGALRTPALHGLIRGELGTFRVDTEGKISGGIKLIGERHMGDDPALEAQFTALGFKDAYGNWQFEGQLSGTRYAANGFKLPASMRDQGAALNRAYSVDVREPDSGLRTAGKVLVTPVAVGADGVVLAGAAAAAVVLVPVVVVFLTVFMIMVNRDNHGR